MESRLAERNNNPLKKHCRLFVIFHSEEDKISLKLECILCYLRSRCSLCFTVQRGHLLHHRTNPRSASFSCAFTARVQPTSHLSSFRVKHVHLIPFAGDTVGKNNEKGAHSFTSCFLYIVFFPPRCN